MENEIYKEVRIIQHSHFRSSLRRFPIKTSIIRQLIENKKSPAASLNPTGPKTTIVGKRVPGGKSTRTDQFCPLRAKKIENNLIKPNRIFIVCTPGSDPRAGEVQSHCARMFFVFLAG